MALFAKNIGTVKVVITDMMMPYMDGPSTIRALRRLDPSLRFIAASGLVGDQKIADIMIDGGIVFLQKPFTADVLLSTLRNVISTN